jgi:multidrug efflux system outer membrane protein
MNGAKIGKAASTGLFQPSGLWQATCTLGFNMRFNMLNTRPIKLRINFSETLARRLLIPILMLCLGLILSSCASVAPQQDKLMPLAIPAGWSNTTTTDAGASAGISSSQPSSLAQWWTRFNDPQLSQLVARAMQTNTDVNRAQAVLRQARAMRDVAAAGLRPTLGSSASASHGTAGGDSSGSLFKAGLDAAWEPDIFGGKQSALDAGDATLRASAASLGDVQVSIAAEVALSYLTLRGAQTRLAIAEANLASQLDTHEITGWRLQAGLVSSLEAEQSLSATEQTRAQLPVLQTSIAQTRHALAVLTGQPPAALTVELTSELATGVATTGFAATAPIPQAADDLVLSFPADTLRQRPDVRAAEQQVAAALARVAQADAARKPSFRIGGSLGLSALTLGALTDGASVVSSLLAGVSLPIFDGGAARATLRAEQAALVQAQEAYRATVLTALKEVEDALVALRGDRERLLRQNLAAESARNAALMARQRYDSGLVDFQVVLETQRSQLGTQDSVASTQTDLAADHVRLYKALGGGWNPEQINTDIAQATRTDPK